MKKVVLLLALCIIGAIGCLGCGGGNSTNNANGPVTSTPNASNSLVFTVSTPHGTYTRGAAIPLTFTVTNTGTQAANFTVGACFDFAVQIKQGTQDIWTGPTGGCGGVIRNVSIGAGATQVYSVNWDQLDSAGTMVLPGAYTLVGKFTPSTLDGVLIGASLVPTFISNPISITITP